LNVARPTKPDGGGRRIPFMNFARRFPGRWATGLAAAGLLAVVLAGCGSSGGSSSSAPAVAAPATTAATSARGGGGGKTVDVTLKDFSITLTGGDSLSPGTYTFSVVNDGPSAHNLTIEGPGVDKQATPTFGSGETKPLTVTLKSGTYDFYCSVPGHKQAGMSVDVTVGS
jgi:uncharacterized cupredoxin-like copper-binding protein